MLRIEHGLDAVKLTAEGDLALNDDSGRPEESMDDTKCMTSTR